MLNLHVVQAEFGDSFILEYGERDAPRFILVDGGPPNTYANHLKFALADLVAGKGRLDLIVLSHIDNDHIYGILDCLQDMKNAGKQHPSQAAQPGGIWYNSFKQNIGIQSEIAPRVLDLAQQAESRGILTLPGGATRGIAEGEQTTRLAGDLGIPVNAGFKDALVLTDNAPVPVPLEGLKIWIAGPSKRNLQRLQRDWLAWLEKNAAGKVTRGVARDTSVPNLSSIIMLLEGGGRQMLLPGDSTGQEMLAGLKALGKLDAAGKIHVDVLKLPHHGSIRNVSEDFFAKVSADLYVISANGQNGNPEFGTLEWIVTSAKRENRTIQILATNETATTKQLLQKYDPHANGYTLTYMKRGQHYVTV